MLGLAFQNPEMMFFTSFEEGECPVCLKRTKSFFLVSLSFAPCLDCFYAFFMKQNTNIVCSETEEDRDYRGMTKDFEFVVPRLIGEGEISYLS